MSRSYRKTPITGITTARSEKEDKRFCNRKWRRMVKEALYYNREVMPSQREAMDVWSMGKDGKRWRGHLKNHPDRYYYIRYRGEWCVTTTEEWREMYDRMMRK